MQLIYNSDSFTVVAFDVEGRAVAGSLAPAPGDEKLSHGGYEIVDKFARKEIFLHGAMAEHFKDGVAALIETRPSEEEFDDYIARFSSLMQQPVVLH
jgi:hypothetical protein